jgi:hypothetical protein
MKYLTRPEKQHQHHNLPPKTEPHTEPPPRESYMDEMLRIQREREEPVMTHYQVRIEGIRNLVEF